jgi:hypothetical protein
MEKIIITAEIRIRGVNPYVLVSNELARHIKADWRKPMPVSVEINSLPESWSTNMMPNGNGDFLLYLHGLMRSASQAAVGDVVRLAICFNTAYHNGPLHEIPDWFQKALQESPLAQANWDVLSPSRKKEVLRNFDGLKSEAAKERNLERAIYVLNGNDGRFMGRDWHDGA